MPGIGKPKATRKGRVEKSWTFVFQDDIGTGLCKLDARGRLAFFPGPTPQGRELVFITRSAAHSKCVSGVRGLDGDFAFERLSLRGPDVRVCAGEGEEVKPVA